MTRVLTCSLAVAIMELAAPARADVSDPGSVTGVSVVSAPGRAEVVIAISGAVQLKDFILKDPARLVLDLTGTTLDSRALGLYDGVNRGGVLNVRTGQYSAQVVRVVIELDAVKDYAYDPEKAKAMLAEAGVTNLSTDLWYMPVQRPYNPNARRIAELMQADLAKVGVKAEIKSFEWGEYRKRMQAGEHQMGMLGWTGDNGDPDNFLHTLLGCDSAQGVSGSNVAKFCHKPFDDLVVKAKTVSKQAERTDLYKKAQVIFKEQAPWFTIAHAVQLKPVRKEVIDFKLSPFGRHTFYGVDLEE